MKSSPFVMTAPTNQEKHLLYHTAQGVLARVSQPVFDCFQSFGEATPNPFSCSEAISPYVDQLQQAGFLVEDPEAERRQVFGQFSQNRTQTHTLSLAIAPTYACNCRCPYCYEADKAAPWVFMGADVERAIYSFVEERHHALGFSTLEVEWYGGDPQLCLGLVSRMAQCLWDFCQQNGITYTSMMLTNATRIGKAEAEQIAAAHVSSALITLDGPEEQHNFRRPMVEEGNAFQNIKAAIVHLLNAGVSVDALCNSDKVNLPLLPQLQAELDPLGVTVTPTKLNDYGQSFGTGCFCAPHFDLFTHEEFHQACHDIMAAQGRLTPNTLQALFAPSAGFCRGQKNNYYVIDSSGDVYTCDGFMGDTRHVLFNLLDDSPLVPDAITFNPCEDPQCANCELLPLCWGNCNWERQCCGMPCHPLRTVGDQYLNDWAAHFPATDEEFQLLAGQPQSH